MKKIFYILLVVLLIAIGYYLYQINRKTTIIKAVVRSVINRPNRAEDGYYAIQAEEKGTGRNFTINATGYMNTPLSPQARGESCINIPKVSEGQSIEFNLPTDESGTYIICYKNNAIPVNNYYFKAQ